MSLFLIDFAMVLHVYVGLEKGEKRIKYTRPGLYLTIYAR
jgi:hypothetical protein